MNALTRDLIKLVDMTEEMMKEKEQKEFLSHLLQSNPGIPTYNQTVSLIPHGF